METTDQSPGSSASQDPPASSGEPDAAQAGAPEADVDDSLRDGLRRIGALLAEIGEYARYYMSARVDGVKASARNAGIYAALGLVALLAGVAFVMSAVVLVCFGIAALLAWALGSVWAGALLAGVIYLALLALAALVGVGVLKGKARERTVRKYAARQERQRARFGRDLSQRSQAAAQEK